MFSFPRFGVPLSAVLLAAGLAATPALADDDAIPVTIQDHKFTPSEIHVPAGKKVTLKVENKDSTAEEFDSDDLKVEKVIAGGRTGLVHIQPLDKGTYKFMGEYHSETAKGTVVAE